MSATWALQHTFGLGRIWYLRGLNANDLWTTKVGTEVFNWNGSAWSALDTGTSDVFTGVYPVASNDVWWSADGAFLVHWDGASFAIKATGFFGHVYEDVYVPSAGEIWAVDFFSGAVVRSTDNGANFTDMAAPGGVLGFSIWGTSNSDIWVGGTAGKLFHWNGSVWSTHLVSGTVNAEYFIDIFGFASNDIWAVGGGHDGGVGAAIYHWDGVSWNHVYDGAEVECQGVWGLDSNQMWFSCYSGEVLYWDGASITTQSTINGYDGSFGIWGFAADNVWVGSGDNVDAQVWQFAEHAPPPTPPEDTAHGVGNFPIGGGGWGGLDGGGVTIDNISPTPNATGVVPRPHILFDVLEALGQLDPSSIRIKVNGSFVYDATHNPKWHGGWTGVVSNVENGKHFNLLPPGLFDSESVVTVKVYASDLEGNAVQISWSFTIIEDAGIASVEPLGDRCVKITFTQQMRVDNELFRPSNYAFPIRLGYAKEAYAGQVTPETPALGALVNYVVVCARDYFSLNGRYSVRVDGIHDLYGRTVRAEL